MRQLRRTIACSYMSVSSLNRLLTLSKTSFISEDIEPRMWIVGENEEQGADAEGLGMEATRENLDGDVPRDGRDENVVVRGRTGVV